MDDGMDYTLKINAYSPSTIPMGRLAEYMKDLANLLGEERSVHFVKLEDGSVGLRHRIESEALPKVQVRVAKARAGAGPEEAMRAIRNINRRLKEDNANGALREAEGAEIIQFPGRDDVGTIQGAITEPGSLDGVVVRVGGIQDWVGVHLQTSDGVMHACSARRDVAKRLAVHLYDQEVRVVGSGTWFRMFEKWQLERFYIQTFSVLDDAPLGVVVQRLRAVEGSEWPSVSDPWKELQNIRASGLSGS